MAMPDQNSSGTQGNSGGNPPQHLNPFRLCVEYRKKNWFGTLPLPAREKNPPPTGFTGHTAPWPTGAKLKEWMNDPDRRRANICLRLGGVDSEYEVIGIDVDHYEKGGKDKRGGDQLKALENAHGTLPETWISSARVDGTSGIRMFRVPRGLSFRGKVDKDIECIQKGHRFAVVWPSFNPDSASYYAWFPPGAPLTRDGAAQWNGELPDATQLPLLPDQWIDYLTQGRVAASDVEIDMDSKYSEIMEWADETLPDGDALCFRMREKMEKHLRLIQDEATSHDKIVNAHMNIFHLAQEGHTGWVTATNQVEQAFVDVCIDRDKRDPNELRGEIFRSRSRGLRRIKAQVDAQIAQGAAGVPARDVECSGTDGAAMPTIGGAVPPHDDLFDVPKRKLKPTNEYEQNDDGNAEHFCDMWSNDELGPVVRFIEGYGWIVWHTGDGGERQPHWERDKDGTGIVRRMFQKVKEEQMQYCEDDLHAEYRNQLAAWVRQGSQSVPGGVTQQDIKEAKSAWTAYNKFCTASGNERTANNAISAVKSRLRVRLSLMELDSTPDHLAVANGVVELNVDGPRLRAAEPEDYLTLNTGTPWLRDEEVSNTGKRLWNEYLEKFLPNEEYRRDVQIALGHCLLGGNPHKKLFVFQGASNTGKSVMISMVNAVLGDYAVTTNKSLFQYHKLNPVLAMALPKRVVSIIELSRDTRNALTIDQIKTATGNDMVQAELKGSNEPIERVPFFVPIIVTNTVPNIDGADKALRERLHVIQFNVVEEHPDDTIAARMRVESKTAVLAWLIEGYAEYCRIGRKIPVNAQMKAAKDEFAADFDETSRFVADVIEPHGHYSNMSVRWQDSPEWLVLPKDLHAAYESWCEAMKIKEQHRMNQPKFTMRIGELGFTQKQLRPTGMKAAKYWVGMKVKKSAPQSAMAGVLANINKPV